MTGLRDPVTSSLGFEGGELYRLAYTTLTPGLLVVYVGDGAGSPDAIRVYEVAHA